MHSLRWFLGWIALLGVLTGCAQQNYFAVLPEADGKVGQVTFSNNYGQQSINQAGQAIRVKKPDQEPGKPFIMPPKQIKKLFGSALDAQPLAPQQFLLFFESGSHHLTSASKNTILKIMAAINRRQHPDISLAGHAHPTGHVEMMYKLSEMRAQEVAKLLMARGVSAENIEVSFHGEDMPLAKTNPPRNRRVEVTVR